MFVIWFVACFVWFGLFGIGCLVLIFGLVFGGFYLIRGCFVVCFILVVYVCKWFCLRLFCCVRLTLVWLVAYCVAVWLVISY